MDGFLTVVVVVAGIVFLFRYLRRRELARFRDTDMKTLHELTGADPVSPTSTSGNGSADTSSLPPKLRAVAEEAIASNGSEGLGATLRSAALDDIHAHVLRLLEQILGRRYRIFINKPLADFVRIEKGQGELLGRSVSFLICDPEDFSALFALQLRGAGQAEMAKYRFLSSLMAEVAVPLAALPLMPNLSRAEIEASLEALTPSPLQRRGHE